MSGKPETILLAGPTASGKTALAIRLAKALDGEIINADSMQIYADLPILSARPTADEQDSIPHHLFGVLDASRRASVGWWAREAVRLIAEIEARGRLPILTGGTGLYFNALVRGLAEMPEISEQTRQAVDILESQGLDALRERAEALDPEAAGRISPSDRQRLRRIVEIGLESGQPISAFQRETRPLLSADRYTGLVIEPDRAALYARIERRFDQMMDDGALAEAKQLAARGLDPSLPAMKALGMPRLIAASRGEMEMDDAIARSKQDSRRYAKRQMTWFRNQLPDWRRIDPAAGNEALLADL